MKTSNVFVLVIVAAGICTRACSFTLTFDDIPEGQGLRYYGDQYGVAIGGSYIADHSESTWGPPHSGYNVLRCLDIGGSIAFKWPNKLYSAYSLGAYFSTEPGVVVRLTGYGANIEDPIDSILVGAAGESWNNVYVQLNSQEGRIRSAAFEGVSSPDATAHFAADDMTIVPIPEPSSLLAMGGGLGGMLLLRRRMVNG